MEDKNIKNLIQQLQNFLEKDSNIEKLEETEDVAQENYHSTTKVKKKYLNTIVGVFSDSQKVYLVERDYRGNEYLIPSNNGVNFDATDKIPARDFDEDYYFFLPVTLKNWNHPSRNNVGPRNNKFDHADLTILGEFNTPRGLMVFYDVSYITSGYQRLIGGAFVCNKYVPKDIEWRSEDPMWDEFVNNETQGEQVTEHRGTPTTDDKFKPLGITLFNDVFHIYYYRNNEVYCIKVVDPFKKIEVEIARTYIKKYINNPILSPKANNHWEAMATFNPAVITINDKVHMFYRAQGYNHLSVVGYAHSEDGYMFERTDEPCYVPTKEFTKVVTGLAKPDPRRISGDGWGGCEDPRATVIDDKVHLIYVAFDGYSEPRLALSTIDVDDVEKRNWDNWSDPIFMTPWSNVWGTGNKSGVLFPRKVKGKYAIMHRLWPNICIDYVDDLDFGDGKKYLQTTHQIKIRPNHWDSLKIGAGAPPIEIDEGWLLVYFGVGKQDRGKYKIGLMILDKEEPHKVKYRSSSPVISPEEWYENEGKSGVAYPCGAIIKDGELIIYYGGGDTLVCAAACDLDTVVDELKKDSVDENTMKKSYVHN